MNNALLDTYQLKSLDGVVEAPLEEVRLVKRDGKLYMELFDGTDPTAGSDAEIFDNFALREPYDRVIRCLGWEFDPSIFHKLVFIGMFQCL